MKTTRALVLAMCILYGSSSVGSDTGSGSESTRREVAISVRETADLNVLRPVTGGVPISEGAAPNGTNFTLFDTDGIAVPCQTEVLARWKDDSIRWVLLDFQANPPANGAGQFKLRWGEDAGQTNPNVPVKVFDGSRPSLLSDRVSVRPAKGGLFRIGDRLHVKLTMTDRQGHQFSGVAERFHVESKGDIRSTLLATGALLTSEGARAFGFSVRASVYAGLDKVRLEPQLLIDADTGLFQDIRELSLEVRPASSDWTVTIGGIPASKVKPSSGVRLFQADDQTFRVEGTTKRGSKAPGWAEIIDEKGTVAIAVKDFWQQWPKSLEVDPEALKIGLFPKFEANAFAHMKPWYKYQYWFGEDYYRLRTGQAPRWVIWIDLSGDGPSLAKSANAPLVPSPDPRQAVATGVWGYIVPAGSPGMAEYDKWAENLFDNAYCHSIEAQRDYGQMNWGDWFGERKCNWGNHEYDTPKHILIQFARTGDPKYFHVGHVAARHTAEVDVVQFINANLRRHFEKDLGGGRAYPTRPGLVHQHCVGHVSGFYPVQEIRKLYAELGNGRYLCLSPYNLGHIWTYGMVYDYFLTGDPWMKETVDKIGENLVKLVEDRKFNFKTGSHVGRVNGWTMLAIGGAYELDLKNDRYLRAMKLLADDALSAQDEDTGGWLWRLPSGHCNCETKHIGEAGFISSVRLNGLSLYCRLAGDERIPEVVRRGVTHLNNDTWLEERSDWRYTSCPRTGPIGQTGVTIAALVNSVRLTGDTEHLRILREAWQAKFERLRVAPTARPGLGKSYSTTMYGCPEAMNLFVNGLEETAHR